MVRFVAGVSQIRHRNDANSRSVHTSGTRSSRVETRREKIHSRLFHSPSISLKFSLSIWMESIVVWNSIQLRTRITVVSPTFHARVVCGRHQIRGNPKGPTEEMAKKIKDFLKYHLVFSSAKRWWWEASRNSLQCLHLIASYWISSAQKGHFFIIISLGRTVPAQGLERRRTWLYSSGSFFQ